MLQLLAPSSVYEYLSEHDIADLYNSQRPYTAGRVEGRSSTSTAPTFRSTSSSFSSKLSRRFSRSAKTIPSRPSQDAPQLIKTPWELDRSRRSSVRRRPKILYVPAADVFKTLPREVYDCVIEQLEQLHLGDDHGSPSSYLGELYNLALMSRAWDRAATAKLYRKVHVLANQDHPRMPMVKIKGTSRLKLLRRTLRENRALAKCVRELHMYDIQTLYQNATIEREEIVNLVASLVMACPNLESLVGFHVPYTQAFDRLSYALSTRQHLKERAWLLSEITGFEPDEEDDSEASSEFYHAANDPTEQFLKLNPNNSNLTTLLLHQQQPRLSKPLTFRAIVGAFRQYASLRHLSISGISSSSFTNLTLNALPSNLHSLRLENLPGINDKGLQRFARSHPLTDLQTLILINLEINSLTTIAAFLAPHLANLTAFTLSQNRAPLLPTEPETPIPSLSSTSLRSLHWELHSQASPPPSLLPSSVHNRASISSLSCFPAPTFETVPCLATSLLATHIKNGKFPALRRIRAPHDPQGLFQRLCKPRASVLLPGDMQILSTCAIRHRQLDSLHSHPSTPRSRYKDLTTTYTPTAHNFLATLTELPQDTETASQKDPAEPRTDSATSSPLASEFPAQDLKPFSAFQSTSNMNDDTANAPVHLLTPAHTRLQAQSRLLTARKQVSMYIKVLDPEGEMVVCKPVFGFMGCAGSRIVYEVRSDREILGCGARDESGEGGEEDEDGGAEVRSKWLVGIADVVAGDGVRVVDIF